MKKTIIGRFIKNQKGAAMVEYGVLVALIAIACIVVIAVLGDEIDDVFQQVVNCIQGQGDAAACVPVDD